MWGGCILLINISLLALLLPSAWLDFKYKKVWLPWLLIFFIEGIFISIVGITNIDDCIKGMLPGFILIVISKITDGAIGLGDGYLICVIGCLVGVNKMVGILVISMFLAAVTGCVLMIVLKFGKKRTMPFVPFLLFAFLIQLLTEL